MIGWRCWLAGLLAGFGLAQYLLLPTAWLRSGVLHVAPDGSDLFLGQSRQAAVRTLQRALALASPGETILLWPGTYRETVQVRRGGSPGHPLRIRAAIPGTAVISGAEPPASTQHWRWSPLGGKRFSTRPPWPIQALRIDGLEAFGAVNAGEFERLCRQPQAWPLFLSQKSGRLLLCLPDGRRPEQHQLTIHRPLPPRSQAGGHQNASLWISASHLEISHLHFDFAVGAAIQLVETNDLRIAHNLFSGTDVGVNSNPSRRQPQRIRLEHNAFQHAPQSRWKPWLSWRDLYRHSNSSLAWLDGSDLTLTNNLVVECGDSLKLAPSGGHSVVIGNLIAGCTDDALELDGTAAPLRIENNLISDSFTNLSFSAMPVGPVTVIRNLFLNGPRNGHNTWLKLLGGPVRHLSLRDNWVVSQWIGWYQGQPLEQIHSRGNQLYALHRTGPQATALLPSGRDQFTPLTAANWPDPAAGPAALPRHRSGPIPPPLELSGIGPCWLDPGQRAPFESLAPLLRSGWLKQPVLPGRCR